MEITSLREKIRSSGVSQAQVARTAGIHPSALCRMLAEKRSINPEKIARVSTAIETLIEAEREALAARERILRERTA